MPTALTASVIAPQPAVPHAHWVMVLHGLGDSRQGWLGVVPYLQLPQCGWCVVDAPNSYFGGYSWFRIPGLTGPSDTADDFRADFQNSLRQLDACIGELLEERALSSDKLFLMGFSQGCQMVVAHALRSQRRYAGVVGISGRLGDVDDYPHAFGPHAQAQDCFISHGTHDPLLPIAGSREQCGFLRDELGVRIDWREYAKEHTVDPQQELPDIRAWMQARMGDEGSTAS
ncbi:MAG: alpha/beta fold hydrolase [Planctomycetota bacterium]|nr:MAG: alpha/beta fold hydrolase [Planctomycetota bacterium]